MGKIVFSILVIICVNLIIRVATSVISRFMTEKTADKYPKKYVTITKLIGNTIKYTFYFLALIQVLDIFGFNTSSLIATAGIGGVAIGFGAQSLVKDIISGLFLIMEDQFQVGDSVEINGYEGNVMELGLRTTKLRGYNGELYLIGNGQITTVTNRSKTNQRITLNLEVPYQKDISFYRKAVTDIGNEMKEKYESVIVKKPEFIGVTNMNERTVTITVWGWARQGTQYKFEREFRERFIDYLAKENVELGVSMEKVIKDEVQSQ